MIQILTLKDLNVNCIIIDISTKSKQKIMFYFIIFYTLYPYDSKPNMLWGFYAKTKK